ncbi:MAG: hypothetical protein ACBR14_10660 [Microcoleus sp.]
MTTGDLEIRDRFSTKMVQLPVRVIKITYSLLCDRQYPGWVSYPIAPAKPLYR